MSRRRKQKNKWILYVSAGIILCLILFFFSRPGQLLWSWMNEKIASPSHTVSRIGVPLPDGYSTFGIDVSRYQNQIDWVRVAAFKTDRFSVDFVFIKATEGKSLIDPSFRKNWRGSRSAGIPHGAYHYFKPSVDAEAQANHFCRNVKLERGDLPPVLDIEEAPPWMNREQVTRAALIWLQIVGRYYGVQPVVYAGADFYNNYIKGSPVAAYPLWIAHYYQDRPATFASWKFWQFSDKAQIDGITGPVDVNVFYGNSDLLNAFMKN